MGYSAPRGPAHYDSVKSGESGMTGGGLGRLATLVMLADEADRSNALQISGRWLELLFQESSYLTRYRTCILSSIGNAKTTCTITCRTKNLELLNLVLVGTESLFASGHGRLMTSLITESIRYKISIQRTFWTQEPLRGC